MKQIILIFLAVTVLLSLAAVLVMIPIRNRGRRTECRPESAAEKDMPGNVADSQPDVVPSPSYSRQDDTINTVYSRLEEYFRTEKPYLDGNLTVEAVARRLFTNKLYVSKAVRKYSGLNFCQYVNRHRILYSMELFSRDPSLRMNELATMSGFNAVASFNISFRAFMNESPGDWSRKYRESIMGGKRQ